MKKMNNKGFLLVETLVVATFSLTVLVLLYVQFKNLVVNYNNSYNYNTVEGIYNLNVVKKYLEQNDTTQNALPSRLTSSKPYLLVYNESSRCSASLNLTNLDVCGSFLAAGNFKTVIYASSNVKNLKAYARNTADSNLSEDMRNFIKRLDSEDNKHRLIAEYKNGTFATITYGVVNSYNVSTESIKNALYVSQNGNDSTGKGTISQPYKTIQKAYSVASSTATIYVMNNLSVTSITNFTSNKQITLTSYSTSNQIYNVTKGRVLSNYMFWLTQGSLTLRNITINGNNLEDTRTGIGVSSTGTLTVESGTTIRNFKSPNFSGGAIRISDNQPSARVYINGGTITNNTSTASGAIHVGLAGNLFISGGTISGNSCKSSGGAISSHGNLTMSGGTITNNTAATTGGGLIIGQYNNQPNPAPTFTITGGTIQNNRLANNNGAINTDLDVIDNTTLVQGSTFTHVAGRIYNIRSYSGGKNVDIDSSTIPIPIGTRVQIWDAQSWQPYQKWRFFPTSIVNGVVYYSFQSVGNTNLYLEVAGDPPHIYSESAVDAYTFIQAPDFHWYFTKQSNNSFNVKNKYSNLCLDIKAGIIANGTALQLYTCNNTAAQQWTVVRI